ncbi:MAG: substrate-binding domain-containing protein [Lachnospiraceae bacterium]|nr:substrate-binding domain-containing protein [Lachnospiraceae bacterium]
MKKSDRYSNRSFAFMIIGTVIMIVAAVITGIIFSFITRSMQNIEQESTMDYDKHYAFIAEDSENDFWQEVFAAANEQSKEYNVYLEDIKTELGTDNSAEELLRIAVNSKVDGIVYSGGSNDRVRKLIDRASDSGIGVVVLQNDVETSRRQCYVGLNYYELGQMYAVQVEKIVGSGNMADTTVDILVDGDMSEGASNLIVMAMEDYLRESSGTEDGEDEAVIPEIVVTRIDAEDIFSAEEKIRNIFLEKVNLPDIMLCANSVYTRCAYQAVVDYNLVGQIQIVGYFANDTILDAVDKQVIFSTISVDTNEMGKSCIQALYEYNNMGYTNSYLPVGIEVVDQVKAHEMIQEKADKRDEE